MRLCQVTGTVYGEAKHPDYRGLKLLVVQPITPDGRLKGSSLLAVDTARAGSRGTSTSTRISPSSIAVS